MLAYRTNWMDPLAGSGSSKKEYSHKKGIEKANSCLSGP